MWVFQIGTFSNRPLGNVLAKLQQWLVKSIEVNCSHCWGFRNQAVEAKIPGEIGQNYCRWFPFWIEKGFGVIVDEWEKIKAWFFAMIGNMLFGTLKRNIWEGHQNLLDDYFYYWLQMTFKNTSWCYWAFLSVVYIRKVAPRNILCCLP